MVMMRKTYLQPKAEAFYITCDDNFLQSGETGIGRGSDMDDPDDTQNPF